MRIGFIGLGAMGMPIAANYVKAGFDVRVHNRSQGKVQQMVARGATAGVSPADVARDSELVMTCLQGADTVRDVLLGPDGALATAAPGLIVVDHSTIGPEPAKALAAACAERGVVYLDAPVSGAGPVAWAGNLTIMVGGDAAAAAKVRPVLEKTAKQVFHTGGVGSGNITKLINNLLLNTNLAATMEALVLGAKLGVDLQALWEAVRTASGASTQWEKVTPNLLERRFTPPTGAIRNFTHGQANIRALAAGAGSPTPMFDTACTLWDAALAMGLGDEDPTAAIKVLEASAGVEVHGPTTPG